MAHERDSPGGLTSMKAGAEVVADLDGREKLLLAQALPRRAAIQR
jgi:hypothetical protein